MSKKFKDLLSASSILFGTIVGVGIFGLPYVFSRAGFLPALIFLLVLTIAVLLIHLIYGEIILRTKKKKRLVGYAEQYLGAKGKMIAALSALFGLFGAQLAYLIVGGDFFSLVTGKFLGEDAFIYVLIFALVGAFILFKGSGLLARTELLISFILIGIILLIFGASFPQINFQHFLTLDLGRIFLPYGVILFALSGASVVPEVIDFLRSKKNKQYRAAVTLGSLLPAFLYLLFVVAILGMAGKDTSEKALDILVGRLPPGIVYAGLLFGILAVFTSFIGIGTNLIKILCYDYKISKITSWLIVNLVPLLAFIFGLKSFIGTIGVVGTIMGGIDGILIIVIYQKAKERGDIEPDYQLKLPIFVLGILIAIFGLGIIYQFVDYFR